MNLLDVARLNGRELRALCRSGEYDRPTAGAALGFVQVNLVILPSAYAGSFMEFCRLNRQACPLLEVTTAGSWEPMRMAPGGDVRTDVPRYRVYRFGELVDQTKNVESYWPSRFGPNGDRPVAFLIGCSFTFEDALLRHGLPVRHIEEGRNVPMYRTNRVCRAAGPFEGPMVVSMRPMTMEQAKQAAAITRSMPHVHGAPVHIGDPRELGINDLHTPDYGEAVTIHPGETPVFWACGVTPMEAIMRARPPYAITHEPGHMLVTDVLENELQSGDWSPTD